MTFIRIAGGGHGFGSPKLDERVRQFLEMHLHDKKAKISAEPIKLEPRRPAR